MAAAQRLVDDVKKRAGTAQALREAGELSRLDVTTLQIEMAAVEKDVLDARIEAMAALGDLEDALQRPSDLPVPPPESSDHPEGNSK
jgi:outer membrane protein TolC